MLASVETVSQLLHAYVIDSITGHEAIGYTRHDIDFVDRMYIDSETIGG